MPLGRKVQIIAAAFGGFVTAVIGLLLVFHVVAWTPEQIGAVNLAYASFVAFVVTVAWVLSGKEPPDDTGGAA